jgi:predicted aminopeptidase
MLTEITRAAGTPLLRAALAAALIGALPGCGTTYLAQAAAGQWHVMHERRPIEVVLADQHTPQPVRETLTDARDAREFASRELHLPDNSSYKTYADIGRPYVVWNVVATPEFSVEPKHWCFPIAGCVAYRGYFSEHKAQEFAAGLASKDLDVVVEGVPAYSTLGKLSDPLLSSMLSYGETELAATIFHELAHQLLYVKNDSQFNEAFAVTVEEAGLDRWLKARGEPDEIQAHRKMRERERAFIALFARGRARLARLYASGLPPAEMRQQKSEILLDIGKELTQLQQQLHVHSIVYDEWLAHGLNNAHLASLATYYDCVPGFEHLLAEQGGDLPRFYAAARELSHLPKQQRQETLCRKPQ